MKPGISRNCETPWHRKVKASSETCLRWPSCGLGRKKQKETDEQKNPALLKRTTSFQPTSSESQAAGSPAFSQFLFFFFNYCYDWLHWVFTVVDELSLVGAWGSLVFVHRHSLGGLSSLTRDWTCIPCTERQIFNHRTTREGPNLIPKSQTKLYTWSVD